jgi:hypothetical protein
LQKIHGSGELIYKTGRMKRIFINTLLLLFLPLALVCAPNDSKQTGAVKPVCDISCVPASFPVGFALLTHGNRQFVAYYDAEHNMTVASRKLNSKTWEYKILDNKIGWDSHNYVAMKIDSEGYIHVSGNMHVAKLIYYKSAKPLDIQSLTRVTGMVGREEDKVTYPVFMDGPKGEFLFHYRYGTSGNGYEIYNLWNPQKQTWSRYLDTPLIDGRGERNAYMQAPVLGPDNYYHLIWVWRETPDCATNHTLSYARSKDLLHWESVTGKKVPLPITIEEQALYVDPTPPGGGLLNPGIRLGFDPSGKALIGYHKYDKDMNTQLFVARFDNGKWINKQVTDWNFRWIFQGNGTIITELSIDKPRSLYDGRVAFGFHRRDTGDGEILLDGKTLDPVGERSLTHSYPGSPDQVESTFPGMTVSRALDSGKSPKKNETYMLRWETLPANRDAKREGELPPPSVLRLYKFVR